MRKNKRILPLTLFCAVAALAFIMIIPGALVQGAAQATVTAKPSSATGTPAKPALSTADVTLDKLGVNDMELTSPSGVAQFHFQMPENWQPDGNNKLHLAVEYLQDSDPKDQQAASLQSIFDVYFDDKFAGSLHLNASAVGMQGIDIPLSAGILSDPTRQDHTVRLMFDAQEYCKINVQTRVIVHPELSSFHFEYHPLAPTLDLAKYPRPFYNQNFDSTADPLTIVLPANKTAADLNAAASIAAGLGRLSNNKLTFNVVDADNLTDDARKNSNLILIGQLGTNALIDSYYKDNRFPTQLDGTTLSANKNTVDAKDGVVQIIANPDNPMRAVLAVTGQSPEGLQKAAQALAGPPSPTAVSGPLALVSDVRPAINTNTLPGTTLTFADLGYTADDLSVSGRGKRVIDVEFTMPMDTQLTSDAYVNLLFNYSQRIEGARTTVSLLMNGVPFGSTMLLPKGDGTPDSPGNLTLKAAIPSDLVSPGERNDLTISVEIDGDWNCYPPGQYGVFFNAHPESQLNLALQSAPTIVDPQVARFPFPFDTSSDLHDTWISLPAQPTNDEVGQALGLVAQMGAATNQGSSFAPQINMGDLPQNFDLSQYNIIVIGRPSTNAFLKTLNQNLPQPFADNSDDFQQVLDNVSYRVLPGAELGALEVFKSPWAANKVVLVVTGNGTLGEANAASVLLGTTKVQQAALRGDVVFASGNQATAINSQNTKAIANMLTQVPVMATNAVLTATAQNNPDLVTATPQPSDTPGPSPTATSLYTMTPSPTVPTEIPTFAPLDPADTTPVRPDRPGWLNILAGATIALLGIIGVVGLLKALRSGQREA